MNGKIGKRDIFPICFILLGHRATAAGSRAGREGGRKANRALRFEEAMNEAETRAEHIDPALKAAGWVWSRVAASCAPSCLALEDIKG